MFYAFKLFVISSLLLFNVLQYNGIYSSDLFLIDAKSFSKKFLFCISQTFSFFSLH